MAIDSGDAAMMGLVIGGAAGHVLSDGDPIVTVLGAGVGWAVGGPGGASAGLSQGGDADAEAGSDESDEMAEEPESEPKNDFQITDFPLD